MGDSVRFYKVGLSLQAATGVNDLVRRLIDNGKKVFLDYKYYDIAETISKAVGRVAKLGVSFLTIHGTTSVIKAAVAARGDSELKLFTVTVLTSMDLADVHEMGIAADSVQEVVLRRSLIAWRNGSDGVIASGQEVREIKKLIASNMPDGGKRGLLVTTPGIRSEGYPAQDQKRVATPRHAVSEGADYLVIGRQVTNPGDITPRKAAERVVEEMQSAFNSLSQEPE